MNAIQAYLRAVVSDEKQVLATGAFDVFVDAVSTHPYANYAIPRDASEPDDEAVAELIAVMERAGRIPRLEYLPTAAPDVEERMLDSGFAVELRTPVLCCEAGGLADVDTPDGVTFDVLGPDAEREPIEALVRAQSEAFGVTYDPRDVERVAPMLGRRIAVVAFCEGEVIGGGMCQVPIAGVTEMVGMAVREPFRRRGVATALTADLAQRAFAAGVETVFMTPGDSGARQAYEDAGFESADEMLHLIYGA